MGALANSEDPDKGLHCLLRLEQLSGTEIHHNLETSLATSLNTKWAIPYLLYEYVWENPLDYKGLL